MISGDDKRIEPCDDCEGKSCMNLVDLKASPEDGEEISKQVLQDIGKELNRNPTVPRYLITNMVFNKEGRNVDKMILMHL